MTDTTKNSDDHKGDQKAEVEGAEQEVRERAHKLWKAEESQEGRVDEYWHRAQELIDDEAKSAYPPAQSRGNRT